MSNKILVLQGGTSDEREVSLRSAANVIGWLEKDGYNVVVADPASADFNLADLSAHCDVVLPLLHGEGGEDGYLQGQLQELQKPFLGSDSGACELTFNKALYREFVIKQKIQMPQGVVVDRAQFDTAALRQAPYVLKPIDGGSSVDNVILPDLSKEPDSSYFDELFNRHREMLLEQLIGGQELTVGILRNKALPVIHIVPPENEEFDYENKYNGRSQEIVNPPDIPHEKQREAQNLALKLHVLTGCRHISRSDFILAEDGTLYTLETNTIPGMTEQSLFPKMAAADGVGMAALVRSFVEMAEGL
nr:D-ala D-ala ligase C-terminus [uncultured bacterium]